ncbi:MAG TPA: endolytic transglycosylase MltG [Acidimicrobiales bacterium]|nr:endolytic transglycosylase MltG [Acidimicrobiales bacterium]
MTEGDRPPRYGGDAQLAPNTSNPDEQAATQGVRSAVGRHPWRTLALSVAVIIVVIGGAGVLWIDHQGNTGVPGGPKVIVHVHQGEDTAAVATKLQRDKVVGNALALQAWLLLHGAPSIGTGNYVFHQHESFASVKSDLEAGPNVLLLQLPPGSSVEQVSQQVAQLPGHDGTAFLALATGGTLRSPWSPAGSTNLDGLLGAGTYQVMPGETDTQLLIQMIERFNQMAKSVGLAASEQKVGRTPYEVITVASIVQKEAGIAKNMAPVSRVIYNRLAAGIPLQSDATLRYSEHRNGGAVTPQDEQQSTAYNTFTNKGLTPTPICSPSAVALRAALSPAQGSWRYYVVTGKDGTESFATTEVQNRADQALARQRGLQ